MTLTTLGESGSVQNNGLTSRLVATIGAFTQRVGLLTSPSKDSRVGAFSPENFLEKPYISSSQLMGLSLKESELLVNYVLGNKLLENAKFLAKFGGAEFALALIGREVDRKGSEISPELREYYNTIDGKFGRTFLDNIGDQSK